MGTHSDGPSYLQTNGQHQQLKEWIAKNPSCLGSNSARYSDGNLPFLFKVLSIRKGLAIQAHPDKVRFIYALRQKLRAIQYFFKIYFSSFFLKDDRSWTRNAFLLIFHYRLNNGLQFEANYEIKLLVITSGKKGDNTDILKLQKSFIWLLFFNNLRKRMSHTFFRTFEWMYGKALSRTFTNHQVYAKAHTLAYSFDELGDEVSFVGIATILLELRC